MTSYVGLDVSLAETSVCVLGGDGRVRFEGKVKTRPDDLIGCLRKHAGDAERVGMETGQTAGVLFRALKAAELPILCLETRHAHRALSARTNKTDRNDARGLAELMRVGWYREAWIRGASANAIRSLLLLGRRLLLQTKRTLENTLRGGVKRFGLITDKTAGRTFTHRAASVIDRDPAYAAFAMPILTVLRSVLVQIREDDRQLRALARRDGTVTRLMTVPGIGYLTALAFYSTVEDPAWFKRSDDIGPYLGLTPRVHQSGEIDRTGRITKTGDAMTRSYLFEAANVLLTRIRRPTPLRLWGLRLRDRAGLKKAQVAVARKLAVMMHAIWTDGTEFEWRAAPM
jgi:transposase